MILKLLSIKLKSGIWLPKVIFIEGDWFCSKRRSLGVKDEIFCLFEGALDNLGSLRNHYGLPKSVNEVILVIEAYKALRDRAPYPAEHVVGHLSGSFAFILFDNSTSTLFVASVTTHSCQISEIEIEIGIRDLLFFCVLIEIAIAIAIDFRDLYWFLVVFAGSIREGASVLGNHGRWIRRVRRRCRASERRLRKITGLVSSR